MEEQERMLKILGDMSNAGKFPYGYYMTNKKRFDEVQAKEKRVLKINKLILKISKEQKTSKDTPLKTLLVVVPHRILSNARNQKN